MDKEKSVLKEDEGIKQLLDHMCIYQLDQIYLFQSELRVNCVWRWCREGGRSRCQYTMISIMLVRGVALITSGMCVEHDVRDVWRMCYQECQWEEVCGGRMSWRMTYLRKNWYLIDVEVFIQLGESIITGGIRQMTWQGINWWMPSSEYVEERRQCSAQILQGFE